jgi:hypothetical protein
MMTDDDDDDWGSNSEINEWQGKLNYTEEACSSAAMTTTDHI